ncbi:MAG: DUF4424 family protein [Sphingomonadaceae bacterium]|nr:DUF4424 family protein [Sphingomonadaceae bacterium]
MRLASTLLAAPLLAFALPALANDSEAEWAVGGLVLKQNDAISMDAEELYISEAEVRVDYTYTNQSEKDVELTISFPLPPLPEKGLYYDYYRAMPDWDQLKFRTTVDGEEVEWTASDRAMIGGKDVTAKVETEELPVLWYGPADLPQALDKMPPEKLARLEAAGLIKRDSIYGTEWLPVWQVQRHIVRTQTFPARKAVHVSHRYKPINGGSVGGMLYPGPRNDYPEGLQEYRQRWCVDDSFLAGFDRRDAEMKARAPNGEAYYGETWIGYILSTGANWRGPIKDFRLVVDKSSPDNLVSFCMDGVKKVSDTRFEVRKQNFEPKGDLNILLVQWWRVED